ncbi:MAG: dihydrofolate reductase family protein [Chthoniobacteraceae bacterium]
MKKLARPFVTANFAVTADGRISTRRRTPADFSSKRDKHRLLEIRAECDAILVGIGTVTTDNMALGLPDPELRRARLAAGRREYPLRVLLTNSGRIPTRLRLFTKTFSPIHIFSTERMPRLARSRLAAKASLHLDDSPDVDLARMLATLRKDCGVRRLVCEGGARVLRSLLEADLLDELHVTVCPRIFGGSQAPTLTGIADSYLPRSVSLELCDFDIVDAECFLRYRVTRS